MNFMENPKKSDTWNIMEPITSRRKYIEHRSLKFWNDSLKERLL